MNISNWSEGFSPVNKGHISFHTDDQSSPMREGLYLLKLQLKGQKEVNGWFFINHSDVIENPIIQNPQINQSISRKNLFLKWQDFRSSNYSEYEQRKRTFHLTSDSDTKIDYGFAVINPKDETNLALGKDDRWPETKNLNIGQYYLSLRCEERSFFGDIVVGRSVTTGVPFKIIE